MAKKQGLLCAPENPKRDTSEILGSQLCKLRFELFYAFEEVLVLGLGIVCSIALTIDCTLAPIRATAPHLDLLTKFIIFGLQSPDPLAQEDKNGNVRRGDLVRHVDPLSGVRGRSALLRIGPAGDLARGSIEFEPDGGGRVALSYPPRAGEAVNQE